MEEYPEYFKGVHGIVYKISDIHLTKKDRAVFARFFFWNCGWKKGKNFPQ
jgi:hypothetical protein